MTIRQLPVVGSPADPPASLRKIAIEEHFIDPAQVHPNYGDSFSGEFDQEGSSYAGFNPGAALTSRASGSPACVFHCRR